LEIVNEKMATFLTLLNNTRRNDIFVRAKGGGGKKRPSFNVFCRKTAF